MPRVLISCIPKLSEIQQQGMLQLFGDLEAQGMEVCFWSDNKYPLLQLYDIEKTIFPVKEPAKLKRYWYYLKASLSIDKKKWLPRIKRWTGNDDEASANDKLAGYLKESARVLAIISPDHFFCWNPYCCRYGLAYDVAKGLGFKTYGLEWGYLPNTFLLDRSGTLASSTLFNTNPVAVFNKEEQSAFAEKGKLIFDQLKAQSLSLYNQARVEIPADFLTIDTAKRILVLGIDELDAGAYPANHEERKGLLPFHTSSYAQALDVAHMDKNYRVIYKPHPSHNLYSKNIRDGNMAVVNGNPDELIDWAGVVFCSGSKMEFSVLLKSKPLLTYGSGLLYGKKCSYEVSSPADAAACIARALNGAEDAIQLQNFIAFLGYLDSEYLYNFTGGNPKVIKTLLHQ